MTTPATPWLTIDQAAERLDVHVRTVERLVRSGRLTEYRSPAKRRERRYRAEDVDALLEPEPTD